MPKLTSEEIAALHASGNLDATALFIRVWETIKDDVFHYCRRQSINSIPISIDDAKDLTQEIAIRILRGLPGWNGRSFKVWVYHICRNCVITYFIRKEKEELRSLPLPDENGPGEIADEDSQLYTEKGTNLDSGETLRYLLDAIIHTRWPTSNKFYMDELDREIIQLKLDHPRLSSAELAKYLGISVANYDIRFCRVQVAIRVYCFLHRPGLLGGLSCIRTRYNQLLARVPPGLNGQESAIFKSLVLDRVFNTRINGWQDALRSACTKMLLT